MAHTIMSAVAGLTAWRKACNLGGHKTKLSTTPCAKSESAACLGLGCTNSTGHSVSRNNKVSHQSAGRHSHGGMQVEAVAGQQAVAYWVRKVVQFNQLGKPNGLVCSEHLGVVVLAKNGASAVQNCNVEATMHFSCTALQLHCNE